MSDTRVPDAYGARADEYVNLFGEIDAAAAEDRAFVLAWARAVDGPIIDVGCGPGQWTNLLHEHGVDVEGIDPTRAFIEHARSRYPDVTFGIGHAEQLEVDDASLGGILAWFSLIHTEPDRVDAPLAEFARCIRSGGGLAIGFFEGTELVPFDHAVTTAYFWPVDQLSARLEAAGFAVVDVQTRTDPGTRPQGTIIARRAG